MAVRIDIEVLRQGVGNGPGAAGGPGRGAAGAAFGMVVKAQRQVARALLIGANDVFDAAQSECLGITKFVQPSLYSAVSSSVTVHTS